MVTIRWYLGCLNGRLGGAGRDRNLDVDTEVNPLNGVEVPLTEFGVPVGLV